jgi:hypothetical protein
MHRKFLSSSATSSIELQSIPPRADSQAFLTSNTVLSDLLFLVSQLPDRATRFFSPSFSQKRTWHEVNWFGIPSWIEVGGFAIWEKVETTMSRTSGLLTQGCGHNTRGRRVRRCALPRDGTNVVKLSKTFPRLYSFNANQIRPKDLTLPPSHCRSRCS